MSWGRKSKAAMFVEWAPQRWEGSWGQRGQCRSWGTLSAVEGSLVSYSERDGSHWEIENRIMIWSDSNLHRPHGSYMEDRQPWDKGEMALAVILGTGWLFRLGWWWWGWCTWSVSRYVLKGYGEGGKGLSRAILPFWTVQLDKLWYNMAGGDEGRGRFLCWWRELEGSVLTC